jgi:hypothetical protein
MKGNGKKLAVFLIVAAIAMFIAGPTASANDFWWKSLIHGEYAFSGSGACTLAPGGFDENFKPYNATYASMGPNFWEGVYTFNYNGKGKMEARQSYQLGPDPMFPYSAGSDLLSWEFEYKMDGPEITFTFIPGTYTLEYLEGPNKGVKLPLPNESSSQVTFDQPWTGRISPDGRNLFVFYGGPAKLKVPEFGIELICNAVHQGFKTH